MTHPRDRRSSPASGVAVAGWSDSRSQYPDPPSSRTGGTVYGGRPGDDFDPFAVPPARMDVRGGADLEQDLFAPSPRRETTGRQGGAERTAGRRPAAAGGRSNRPPSGPGAPDVPRKKKRRDPLWARLAVIFGALLMVASGGAIVAEKLLVAQVTSGVDKAPLLGDAGVAQGAKALDGALNLLMVGVDERPPEIRNDDDLVRADSIMIVHIPASHDQAYMMSFPRDAYVDIPAYPKTKFKGGKEKINAAFAFGWQNGGGREGGFELLALTVNKLTGLKFNAGAIVDFQGFEKIVDALGGIDMCIDGNTTVVSEHWGWDKKGHYLDPHKGGKPMTYQPGTCPHLAGWAALDYVRQRKSLPDGDYGRQRHQQQFVKALAKEAKKQGIEKNPVRFLSLLKAAGSALTVDLHGASFETWAFTLRSVTENDMVLLKSNGGKFDPVPCGNEQCEGLTQETMDMFKAIQNDTVGEFVINHPDFVST